MKLHSLHCVKLFYNGNERTIGPLVKSVVLEKSEAVSWMDFIVKSLLRFSMRAPFGPFRFPALPLSPLCVEHTGQVSVLVSNEFVCDKLARPFV